MENRNDRNLSKEERVKKEMKKIRYLRDKLREFRKKKAKQKQAD